MRMVDNRRPTCITLQHLDHSMHLREDACCLDEFEVLGFKGSKPAIVVSEAAGKPSAGRKRKGAPPPVDFMAMVCAGKTPARSKCPRSTAGTSNDAVGAPVGAPVLAIQDLPAVDFMSLIQSGATEQEKQDKQDAYNGFKDELVGVFGAEENECAELFVECPDDEEEEEEEEAEESVVQDELPLPPRPPVPRRNVSKSLVQDEVPLPPRPPVPDGDRHKRTVSKSQWSRDWGLFHMNFREPGGSSKFGAWSTVCPIHTTYGPNGSKCTCSLTLSSSDDKLEAMRLSFVTRATNLILAHLICFCCLVTADLICLVN